jgi:hypothetical protein
MEKSKPHRSKTIKRALDEILDVKTASVSQEQATQRAIKTIDNIVQEIDSRLCIVVKNEKEKSSHGFYVPIEIKICELNAELTSLHLYTTDVIPFMQREGSKENPKWPYDVFDRRKTRVSSMRCIVSQTPEEMRVVIRQLIKKACDTEVRTLQSQREHSQKKFERFAEMEEFEKRVRLSIRRGS